MSSNNKNSLKRLPFYGEKIKPEIKGFANAKLLSELPFLEKRIKTNIKQVSIKDLLSEQPFYKQPIKKTRQKLTNLQFYVYFPFMMMLVFLKDIGH